jgi:hypothetical protein
MISRIRGKHSNLVNRNMYKQMIVLPALSSSWLPEDCWIKGVFRDIHPVHHVNPV